LVTLRLPPGASSEEIAAARRAVENATVELLWLADALKLYQENQATVRYFGRA
jgi:hypothetical protein